MCHPEISGQQVVGIPLPAKADLPIAAPPKKSPGEAAQPGSAPYAASRRVPAEGALTSLPLSLALA